MSFESLGYIYVQGCNKLEPIDFYVVWKNQLSALMQGSQKQETSHCEYVKKYSACYSKLFG